MAHHTTWDDLLRPGIAGDFFARQPFAPFDPAVPGYHPANARWLAELCRIVYRHDHEETDRPREPTRTALLEQAGFTSRAFFHNRVTHTQALLVVCTRAPSYAALVFRGTEQGVADWITNLGVVKKRWEQGPARVHGGFLRALDSVWESILPELERLTVPLFIAGHSLGGALATLAGVRCRPAAVYTFGSPRVGDKAFAALCAGLPICRVVDDRDTVATVPPAWFGFQHAGAPSVLLEGGIDEPEGAGGAGPPKFLADHAPVNYVDRARSVDP